MKRMNIQNITAAFMLLAVFILFWAENSRANRAAERVGESTEQRKKLLVALESALESIRLRDELIAAYGKTHAEMTVEISAYRLKECRQVEPRKMDDDLPKEQ